MRELFWILDGHTPVTVGTVSEWNAWIEWATQAGLRRVAFDVVGNGFLSTVFLGVDRGYGQTAAPVLFETMLFTKDGPGELIERYTTWDAALTGHRAALILLDAKALA